MFSRAVAEAFLEAAVPRAHVAAARINPRMRATEPFLWFCLMLGPAIAERWNG